MLKELFPAELPKLFLFDMDHTLLDNDCDLSWKEFLVERTLAPLSAIQEGDHYYDLYCQGKLEIDTFLDFQLKEFVGKTKAEMEKLSEEHFIQKVKPKIYPFFKELLSEVAEKDIPTAIVTATNDVVAGTTANFLNITKLISTQTELINGIYTGKISGLYNYSEQKISRAKEYVDELSITLNECAYFGDSLSDYPLLKSVGFPFMVNPKEALIKKPESQKWPTLSLEL